MARSTAIPVNDDGSAGTIVPIETSMPLGRPYGLRTAGPQTLIQTEQEGRLTELTITGIAQRCAWCRMASGARRCDPVGTTALVLVDWG